MTRLMPQDWHVAAYEAALRGDEDAIIASVAELGTYGGDTIERALQAWMDRTQFVMECTAKVTKKSLGFVVEAHASTPDGPPQINQEMAWGGQLFAARVQGDQQKWDLLFTAIPPGEELTSALVMTLKMLTITAGTAAEAASELQQEIPPAGRTIHQVPLMTRAAQMARSHLN